MSSQQQPKIYVGTVAANVYDRACAYFDQENYDHAILEFTELIRLIPTHAQSYFNRGSCYYRKSDYVLAIADYKEAIRLDPSDADFNTALAEAEAAARTAGLDPSSAHFHKAVADAQACRAAKARQAAGGLTSSPQEQRTAPTSQRAVPQQATVKNIHCLSADWSCPCGVINRVTDGYWPENSLITCSSCKRQFGFPEEWRQTGRSYSTAPVSQSAVQQTPEGETQANPTTAYGTTSKFICTNCFSQFSCDPPSVVGSAKKCPECFQNFEVTRFLGDRTTSWSINFSLFASNKCPSCKSKKTHYVGQTGHHQRVIDGTWCNAYVEIYVCEACKSSWGKCDYRYS